MWIAASLWLVDAIFYILPPRSSSCQAMQLVKFVTLHIVLAWFIPESEEYRIKVNGNQYCIWLLIFPNDWQVYWYFCQHTLIGICVSTICMQRTMTMCSSLEMNLRRGKSCRRFAENLFGIFAEAPSCLLDLHQPYFPIPATANNWYSESSNIGEGGSGGLTLWPNVRSSGS